jgi:leucine dehydrogenase
MGAILDDRTIPRLRARVVAGAANNQLAEDRHGQALADRGILYLPDYVANGGGLMSCAAEWYREEAALIPARVLGIFNTCNEILERARTANLTTNAAADLIARERIAARQIAR